MKSKYGQKVGDSYANIISKEICDDYAKTGRYPRRLSSLADKYALLHKRDQEKAAMLHQCAAYIRRLNNEQWGIGNYAKFISDKMCPYYASTGIFQADYLNNLVNHYSQLYRKEQKERADRMLAMEWENKGIQAEKRFRTALPAANQKARKINSSGQLRAFVVIYKGWGGEKNVYLHSFVIRSMSAGTTFGGSKIVDSNIRTEVNGDNYGEMRIRIFCNEGQSTRIAAGETMHPQIPITAEMGRWACGRYNFYHP